MDKPTRTSAIPNNEQPLDNTTLTSADLDSGTLTAPIGIAPTRPAESIDLKIQDWPDAYPSTKTPGKPPIAMKKRNP